MFLGPLYQPPGAAAAGAVAVRMGFEKLGLQGRNKLQVAKTLGNLYLHPLSHLPVTTRCPGRWHRHWHSLTPLYVLLALCPLLQVSGRPAGPRPLLRLEKLARLGLQGAPLCLQLVLGAKEPYSVFLGSSLKFEIHFYFHLPQACERLTEASAP